MTIEEIKKNLKNNCMSAKNPKKIFIANEIKAIHLMQDDNLGVDKMASYFHCRSQKISLIKKLLDEKKPKKDGDYEKICKEINS